MMNTFIGLFMILLTVSVFLMTRTLYKKYPNPFLNPVLISTIVLIVILLSFHISYSTYMIGGEWINKLLSATVVALAYPLYQYRTILMTYSKIILTSLFTSIVVNIFSVYFLMFALGYSKNLTISAFPKCITTAIALEVSSQSGGIPSLTSVFVMISGFTGAIVGPYIVHFCHFETPIARGLALGNASHVIGTSRAFEYDLETGSFSSAGMILSAIFSAFFIPIFVYIFF